MKTCPTCKKEIDNDTNFCPNCGYAFIQADELAPHSNIAAPNELPITIKSLSSEELAKVLMQMEELKEKKNKEVEEELKNKKEAKKKKENLIDVIWGSAFALIAFIICLCYFSFITSFVVSVIVLFGIMIFIMQTRTEIKTMQALDNINSKYK